MSSPSAARSRTGWTRWRQICQFSVALLYLAIPLVNRAGHHQVSGTLAALKIGPIELVEPAGALSAMLAGRHIAASLLIGIAPLVLLALIAGPVFCSWVCPWGLASELIDKARHRGSKYGWGANSWIAVRKLRAGSILLGFAISAVFALPLIALISPPRLLAALPIEAIALKMLPPTGVLLLALLAFELLGPRRVWCRALCPVGALTNFIRSPFTVRVAADPARCLCPSTALCYLQCHWGIDPRLAGRFDGCTNCMRCIEVCPSGAVEVTFALKANRQTRDRDRRQL